MENGTPNQTQSYTYKDLRTEKKYLTYLIGSVLSRFGDSIDVIAYSWIMYAVTGNASLLALTVAVNYIPTVFFQPFFGVLVEKMNKKAVCVTVQVLRGLLVLLTVFLYINNSLSAPYLLIATFLTSTLEAFQIPADMALLPHILDMSKLLVAKSLSASLSSIAQLTGLACAGSIVMAWGAETALSIDAATFFISAALTIFIPIHETISDRNVTVSALTKNMKEGFKYLISKSVLIRIIILGLALNAINIPFSSLATVYVTDYLHFNAGALSYLNVALLVGITVSSVFAPKIVQKLGIHKTIVFSGAVMSIFYLASPFIGGRGISTFLIYVLLGVSLVIFGIGIGLINVCFGTIFTQNVEPSYLARIGGITNALLTSMMPLTALVVSALAGFLLAEQIFFVIGILNLLLYVIIFFNKGYKQIS